MDKEPVFDNAGNRIELTRQRLCIRNAAERCIKNKMPPIGDKSIATRLAQAERTRKAKARGGSVDEDTGGRKTERIDLDRQWKGAERLAGRPVVVNNARL